MTETPSEQDQVREAVRRRYAAAATRVIQQHATAESALPVLDTSSCCSTAEARCGCGTGSGNKSIITSDLYAIDEVADLPSAAVLASLGCGNPTALAELQPGETVLDLGSGGGIDVLLSATRVGPTGFAYGLDMTDELLLIAERNAAQARVSNVRFLKGEIEHIPLPDSSVDVVISNCVINLSADKPQVLREAFRVLRPGGRFAVSDVLVQGRLPPVVRASLDAWTGCLAGALQDDAYRRLLAETGFEQVDVQVTRVFEAEQACCEETCCAGTSPAALVRAAALQALAAAGGRFVSAFVRATRPVDNP